MRKTLSILVFAFLYSISFAQNNQGTLLWEVSRPGIRYTSYLFGTFHEVTPAFFITLVNANQKLEHSSALFVESADQSADTSGLHALLSWNREKWNTVTDTSQKKVFDAFVKKAEDSSYYELSPLVLYLTIFRLYAQNFCDTLSRQSAELMDSYIQKLAKSRHKQVWSLDENQLTILSTAEKEDKSDKARDMANDVIQLMSKMLADDPGECDEINLYKSFNLNYEFDTETGDPDNLLTGRNNKWLTTLDKAFRNYNCFVAVGFRHLFYRQGLIQQLRRRGYEVKPVPAR